MPWTYDSEPFLFNKGPLILNIESCFFHWQRYPTRRRSMRRPPLHEPAHPREIEQPYRSGVGHAFRFPFLRRGFVVGYWIPAGEAVLAEEESSRLMSAIEGTHIPGITASEISSWSRGRLPWWRRLLGLLLDRWEDHKPSPAVSRAPRVVDPLAAPRAERPDLPDVIPYDGRVYDLEEARVVPGQQQ